METSIALAIYFGGMVLCYFVLCVMIELRNRNEEYEPYEDEIDEVSVFF